MVTNGRSGPVVARLPAVREVPGSNRASSCFHENCCNTQLWTLAAHLQRCLGRLSLPPSEGVSTYGGVIIHVHMAMDESSAYSSLQAVSKVKLQPGLRVGGHLALTDFRPDDPKKTLAYGWRRMESTINIVVVIIIIIIIAIIVLILPQIAHDTYTVGPIETRMVYTVIK